VAKIVVTGLAGFIGFHLGKRLLDQGDEVVGLDNLNPSYDVSLKETRLAKLRREQRGLQFYKLDLADHEAVARVFAAERPDVVVNLAAQAGVRYSLQNPCVYIESNVMGFTNIVEGCREWDVKHLVFASSSSVYGANTKMPYSVHDSVDHPISLYAATKKANEMIAHTYSHLYGLPTTGLRFFTVYGPWGRPDMAYYKFTKAILEGRPIEVYNYGNMQRDFAYVDDVVEGIIRVIERIPEPNPAWSPDHPDPSSSYAPYKIYNVGNSNPLTLLKLIEVLEDCLGLRAEKNLLPMQPGDLQATYADVDDLVRDVGFKPHTPIEVGIKHFVEWYGFYYGLYPSLNAPLDNRPYRR